MVRNRREDTGIDWTNRRVQTIPIEFTKEEEEVYNLLGTLQNTGSFSMITLQKEMCSSKEATGLTLTKMLEDNEQPQEIEGILAKLMALEVNSKAKKTLEIVQQAKDKVIILQSIELLKFTCNGIYILTV